MDQVFWHRIQFIITVTYHYLFPQLTMGLALLIVVMKGLSLKNRDALYNESARFWARIFGLNFAMGVVTGIPLEFQFGTNWSRFSDYAGDVIGQTLAMEGVFAFFLESAFLGLFLYGERKLSARGHFAAAFALFLGSWISGYFIIATNAFMQHPVGYTLGEDGRLHLADFAAFVLNPWALWQYAHNMAASVLTAGFVVAAVGAYWSLMGKHARHARVNLRLGMITAAVSSVLLVFPTGDEHGKMVARHQPATLAAMEGVFQGGPFAELAIIGQPDVAARKLENPIVLPGMLSFLAYGTFGSVVQGIDDFPEADRPGNIELLYYAYHIMAGLGTLFMLTAAVGGFLLWKGRLERTRWMLWILLLAFPFPYIATTAGWWTAELGRQPWIVYGLLRTEAGGSSSVHPGNVVFSILGFSGLYILLSFLFVDHLRRQIVAGPEPSGSH